MSKLTFDIQPSKSKTIHVDDDTLEALEQLRKQLCTKGKLPTYDRVIKFALSYLKAKGV